MDIQADLETWRADLGDPSKAPRLSLVQRQALLDEVIGIVSEHAGLVGRSLVDAILEGSADGRTGSGIIGGRDRALSDVHGIATPGQTEPRPT